MVKIIFLNQLAGPMFLEMAEDISDAIADCILFTGHNCLNKKLSSANLIIKKAPIYNRRSVYSRLISWLHYFFKALFLSFSYNNKPILFIVSNPPFLGLIGYINNLIRKQKYIMLVYDIYPDILYALGKYKRSFVSNLWNKLNELVYSRASTVITIGYDMAEKLNKFKINQLEVIRCWADTDIIFPIEKSDNVMVKKYGLSGKKILLYSGNMGFSHNIEILIEAAKLINRDDIHFLFIGDGAKRKAVENLAMSNKKHVTLLPFQPEHMLPYIMSAGDIGFVAYQAGTEGCMVPSKAYYYLAGGLCLFVIGKKPNELAETVEKYECGRSISSENVSDLLDNLYQVIDNPHLLDFFKINARQASVNLFSRKNTAQFLPFLNL
jgi:glycosyltransferase involved in cell wall biosynthesis